VPKSHGDGGVVVAGSQPKCNDAAAYAVQVQPCTLGNIRDTEDSAHKQDVEVVPVLCEAAKSISCHICQCCLFPSAARTDDL